MPGQKSQLHLNMLQGERKRNKGDHIYGLQWGDPEKSWPHKKVLENYLLPNVDNARIVEIGPGGGRWSRYMGAAQKVYAVDPFPEILEEHMKNIKLPNFERVLNEGSEFPGIEPSSIDFVWAFGVFVHLDIDVIEKYLTNIMEILRVGGKAFIQYSDKSKPEGFKRKGHSVNCPEMMRRMVNRKGYFILAENTAIFNASSVIVIEKPPKDVNVPFHPTGEISMLPPQMYEIIK